MKPHSARLAGVLLLCGAALCVSVWAAPRDPTLAPPEARSAQADGAAQDIPWGEGSVTIVVRNGQPCLVVGTRLYRPRQTLGKYVIERISETEVVLREGKTLRVVPIFDGVTRRAAKPATP